LSVMTKLISFTLFLFLTISSITGQGIEFFHGTWEQVLEEAEATNKMIFVDAYAVWCGPCKKMTKNVFPKEDVGQFYNEHFINVKLDMERGEGLKFKKNYPVKAFPTFFYIAPNGDNILSVTGYRQPKDFIEIGKKAVERYDPSTELAKKYEDGDRSFETVLGYVKGLNARGKSSLAISNEYLRNQDNLTTPENLTFLLEATTEADSRIFDLLVKHREAITNNASAEAVEDCILSACHVTLDKAIEFEMVELKEEAVQKIKLHLPDLGEDFSNRADMRFSAFEQNEKAFLKSCKSYLGSGKSDKVNKSNEILTFTIDNFKGNTNVLAYASKIVKKLNDQLSEECKFNYAKVLHLQGKSDKALEIVNQLINTTDKKGPTRDILRFKQELENS